MRAEVPEISVVIPTREEGCHIGKCLDSVLHGSYPLSKLEILVVDGISRDGTREIVKEYVARYPQIRLLDNPRKITPVALNIGVKAAKGNVIIILGAHSYIDKDFLLQAVKALFTHPEADCVGGIRKVTNNSSWETAIELALQTPIASGSTQHLRNKGFVTTVAYGAYRRETFEKYGLFDERFIRAQDYEFNLRIVRAGGKIYQDPSIKSYYYPRSSPAKLFNQYFQYGDWKMRVLMKHRMLSIKNFIPPLYFLATFGSALGGLASFASFYALSFLIVGYLSGLAISALWAKKHDKEAGNAFWIMVALFLIHAGFSMGFYKGAITSLLRRAFQ